MFILGGTSTGSALVAFFLERECCGLLVRQLLGAAAPCFGLGVAEGAGMIWWDFTVRNGSSCHIYAGFRVVPRNIVNLLRCKHRLGTGLKAEA